MEYISIDGDDIGRKITSFYLSNNASALTQLSTNLKKSTQSISELLRQEGFTIVFCAADGVVAFVDSFYAEYDQLFHKINSNHTPPNINFSAGVGNSLSEAYVALTAAKCNGKNCLFNYNQLPTV